MARPATGEVLERSTKRGTVYALRFRALGQRQYLTLGGRVGRLDTQARRDRTRERDRRRAPRDLAAGRSGARTPSSQARARLPHLRERVVRRGRADLGRAHPRRLPLAALESPAPALRPTTGSARSPSRRSIATARQRSARRERLRAERVTESKKPPGRAPLPPASALPLLDQQDDPAPGRDPGAGASNTATSTATPRRAKRRLLRESKPSRTYLQPDQVDALLTASGLLDERRRAHEGARHGTAPADPRHDDARRP